MNQQKEQISKKKKPLNEHLEHPNRYKTLFYEYLWQKDTWNDKKLHEEAL